MGREVGWGWTMMERRWTDGEEMRKKKTIPCCKVAWRRTRRQHVAGCRGAGGVQGFGCMDGVRRGAGEPARRTTRTMTHDQNTPLNTLQFRVGRGVTMSHHNTPS